ncbi:hypothetical protein ACW2Q0_04975 [Nocardia sp. R16R-3T]
MTRSIPGAELTIVEDAAHPAAAEVSEIVNQLVDDFLANRAGAH